MLLLALLISLIPRVGPWLVRRLFGEETLAIIEDPTFHLFD
jgi:hypothetical protein